MLIILRLIIGSIKKRVVCRVLRAGIAVILLGIYLVLCQEYLFITSVSGPVRLAWGSVFGFSITLLLSALIPAT